MYSDSFPRPGPAAKQWRRSAIWLAVCSLALLAAALVVSQVSALASDPDWDGTAPENISNSALDLAWYPDVAVGSSGRVVVAWSEERLVEGRNIYARDNGGGTWSVPQAVSKTANLSMYPDVLAVGDRYFIAWIDVRQSGPTYTVFEAEFGIGKGRAITSPEPLVDTQPRLAAGAGKLHLVFCADKQGRASLYYASRLLTEAGWPTAERVYTPTVLVGSKWPALAISQDGGTLHLVWQDDDFSVQSIKYMSGTVGGANVSWSSVVTLSTGIARAIRPDIALDSLGNIHVIWGEEIGDFKYIDYTRYADGSWSVPVRIDPYPVQINEATPAVIAPGLALWEGGNRLEVCVAWAGYRAGATVEEVLLRCSPDGGDTWSSATENVSRTKLALEVSISPAIAFSAGGQLHVAWQERAGDGEITTDYEVYYAASIFRVFLPLVLRNY